MNKLLKNIIKIWKNKKAIAEGYYNTLIRHPKIERIAVSRLEICGNCDLINYEGDKCMVPGTAPCCSACGCCLKIKSRSLSSECAHPDGPKWDSLMTDAEEDIYYKKINYKPEI